MPVVTANVFDVAVIFVAFASRTLTVMPDTAIGDNPDDVFNWKAPASHAEAPRPCPNISSAVGMSVVSTAAAPIASAPVFSLKSVIVLINWAAADLLKRFVVPLAVLPAVKLAALVTQWSATIDPVVFWDMSGIP